MHRPVPNVTSIWRSTPLAQLLELAGHPPLFMRVIFTRRILVKSGKKTASRHGGRAGIDGASHMPCHHFRERHGSTPFDHRNAPVRSPLQSTTGRGVCVSYHRLTGSQRRPDRRYTSQLSTNCDSATASPSRVFCKPCRVISM